MKQYKATKEVHMADETMEIFELQAEVCQALANPKRLQIISLLKEGELSAGEMTRATGLTKANLSQHLAILRQKGILLSRREGTTIYYRLARPKITEACAIMHDLLMESLKDKEKLSKRIHGTGDVLAENVSGALESNYGKE